MKNTVAGSRLVIAVVSAVVAAVVVGGVGWAAIPDGSGVVHGCYKSSGTNHKLSVIDSAKTAACPHGYSALTWNQTGPQGAQGPQGSTGEQGAQGQQGTTGATGATGARGPPGTVAGLGMNTQSAQPDTNTSTCVVGQIQLWAGILYPGTQLPANGRILSISSYEALFGLIGTEYGGNGSTTFALPDLTSLAPNYMTYTMCAVGTYP